MSVVLALALLGTANGPAAPQQERDAAHQRMLRAIEADVRLTKGLTGRNTLQPRVMAAMAEVPRHEFVPSSQRHLAYENHPLAIGNGQTISQPYIVALMTDLLEVDAHDSVLEIGTGSGYQAAVLAEVVDEVYSIEIVQALGVSARSRLERLGYDNVEVRIGDGFFGWPERAPFDGIIVTAGATEIPPPLLDQLKPGGRLVIPVGGRLDVQQLVVAEKGSDGRVETSEVLPVRFVPFTRGRQQ